uniref:Peptidase S1 domain-containing protein n=1 Tax=Anopheles culicifacies TaxID=139723 RepID=A0A182MHS5_9DIPT
MVELQADIPFNKRVLPICPYHGREDFPVLENLTIAGWGRKENYMTSNRLMYANVKTVPLEECKTHYENQMLARLNRGIVAEQYCAQGALVEHVYEHVDACQGDSGGPLLVQQANNVILIGVISVGIGCGSKLPGLYTRVGSYFEWINNTITESQSKQTS